MSLTQIKRAVRLLSLAQLRRLDEWLHELIRRAEISGVAEKSAPRKQTFSEHSLGNKTYRLEGIRCGKENCKCARGKLHGPYWYSYSREKGKVVSKYVGKSLPRDVQKGLGGRCKTSHLLLKRDENLLSLNCEQLYMMKTI